MVSVCHPPYPFASRRYAGEAQSHRRFQATAATSSPLPPPGSGPEPRHRERGAGSVLLRVAGGSIVGYLVWRETYLRFLAADSGAALPSAVEDDGSGGNHHDTRTKRPRGAAPSSTSSGESTSPTSQPGHVLRLTTSYYLGLPSYQAFLLQCDPTLLDASTPSWFQVRFRDAESEGAAHRLVHSFRFTNWDALYEQRDARRQLTGFLERLGVEALAPAAGSPPRQDSSAPVSSDFIAEDLPAELSKLPGASTTGARSHGCALEYARLRKALVFADSAETVRAEETLESMPLVLRYTMTFFGAFPMHWASEVHSTPSTI